MISAYTNEQMLDFSSHCRHHWSSPCRASVEQWFPLPATHRSCMCVFNLPSQCVLLLGHWCVVTLHSLWWNYKTMLTHSLYILFWDCYKKNLHVYTKDKININANVFVSFYWGKLFKWWVLWEPKSSLFSSRILSIDASLLC